MLSTLKYVHKNYVHCFNHHRSLIKTTPLEPVEINPLVHPRRILGGGRRQPSFQMLDMHTYFGLGACKGPSGSTSNPIAIEEIESCTVLESPSILTSRSILFPQLTIPEALRSNLLPPLDSSVSNMLSFHLPFVSQRMSDISDIQSFLCNKPPAADFNPSNLKYIPVPPRETLTKILLFIATNINVSFQSVLPSHCLNSATPLPPWVLGYWFDVQELRENHFNKWQRAFDFIRSSQQSLMKLGLPGSEHITTLLSLLDDLDWSGHTQGFKSGSFVSELHTYLSDEWFSDAHIDQMLELVPRQLTEASGPPHCRSELHADCSIQPVLFGNAVESIYLEESSHRLYERGACPELLRKVGRSLETGEYTLLAGVFNINQSHWISYAIDFSTQCHSRNSVW